MFATGTDRQEIGTPDMAMILTIGHLSVFFPFFITSPCEASSRPMIGSRLDVV
jgi:hypothetical protein